jgi:hypothetical protein
VFSRILDASSSRKAPPKLLWYATQLMATIAMAARTWRAAAACRSGAMKPERPTMGGQGIEMFVRRNDVVNSAVQLTIPVVFAKKQAESALVLLYIGVSSKSGVSRRSDGAPADPRFFPKP